MIEIGHSDLIFQAKDLVKSGIMQALLILIFFDILTGYAKAIKYHRLDSKVSINGWIRHFIIIAMTIVVATYARVLHVRPLGYGLAFGFIGGYGLSLLENLEALGIWFPDFLKKFFKQMRERNFEKQNYADYFKKMQEFEQAFKEMEKFESEKGEADQKQEKNKNLKK